MTDESGWTFLDPKQYDVPLLAQAWMALVPPRSGMAVRTSWGKRAVIGPYQDVVGGSWYVDLDSPANWGWWEDWCSQQGFTIEVSPSPYVPGVPVDGWLVTVGGRSSAMGKTRGEALLAALCVGWADLFGEASEMPPAVVAWWEEHGA